jgi:hypothetical protein
MLASTTISTGKTATVKVCPYCKGQSPTCIECDFGGYTEGPTYQRMHTSAPSKPIEISRASREVSLETRLLQNKIQKDYKRLVGIYHNHISLVSEFDLLAARKFWTIQLYKGNDYALQVDILEFLEVFRSVLHRQKVKKSFGSVCFAKGKKSKKA